MNARCVWATARFSSFRGSGIPTEGWVSLSLGDQPASRGLADVGEARPQVDVVRLIERGILVRPSAVERVEVKRRRAALEHLERRLGIAEGLLRRVHGQVVVDELAQVREPRRDVRLRAAGARHRGGQRLPRGVVELVVAPPARPRCASGEPLRPAATPPVASALAAVRRLFWPWARTPAPTMSKRLRHVARDPARPSPSLPGGAAGRDTAPGQKAARSQCDNLTPRATCQAAALCRREVSPASLTA